MSQLSRSLFRAKLAHKVFTQLFEIHLKLTRARLQNSRIASKSIARARGYACTELARGMMSKMYSSGCL